MRESVLALMAAVAAVSPAFAQSADAPAAPAPKTKKVCHFYETGNPLLTGRTCKTVVVSDAPTAATPAAQPVSQVALQTPKA